MLKNISFQPKTLYIILGLAIAAYLAICLPGPIIARLIAVTLLLFFLPGYLLLQVIGLPVTDRLEQTILAIGVSYGLTVVSSLGVLYVAGRLSAPLLLGSSGLIMLVLAMIGLFRPPFTAHYQPLNRLERLYFFTPVIVAALFSFTNLGYADYWGDEMNGLLRAISLTAGSQETIFEHTKGPVEILIPAAFGLLAGRFEPFILRFPFALAYTAGVGGYYLLGKRLFDQNVALLAALILAINGLYIAFGRMVQYQAVVFLMTGLSILMAYRFYQSGHHNTPAGVRSTKKNGPQPAIDGHYLQPGQYLALSLFLFGVGLLAHFDMLLVLPPIGYLVWRRYGWQWLAWKNDWPCLAGAGFILLAVVTIFYLPFLLHSHATQTSSYLSRRIVGDSSWPSNNFDQLYIFAVMYNSGYYIIFIALSGAGMIAADLIKLLRHSSQNRRPWLMIGGALILALLAVAIGRASLVPMLISFLLLGLLIGDPAISIELKMVYLWLGVSFIGYVFFVDHPRSHLRIIYPAWSLLSALAITHLGSSLRRHRPVLPSRWLTVGPIVLLGLLFGFFAYYQYLLFVDSQTEYIFTYPDHKNPLYWEDAKFPFGSRRLYGAPHRLGWQMIHSLYSQGHFQDDWDSNDYGSNLFWYTLGAPRNPCYPRYYFLTQFEQRERTQDLPNLAQAGYAQIGQVWNHNRQQIEIYEFAPLGHFDKMAILSEPTGYDSFIVPGDFRSFPDEEIKPDISNPLPNPPTFSPSPTALQQIAGHYGDSRIVNVRDKAALMGYDLAETWAKPGGVFVLTLYWQALEVINLPYKIFVHLESNPTQAGPAKLWAQSDDFPACGAQSTRHWPPGQPIADRHVLRLPADIPPGDYILWAGLYEAETGLRMDLLDSMGNPQGIRFELTRLTVRHAD